MHSYPFQNYFTHLDDVMSEADFVQIIEFPMLQDWKLGSVTFGHQNI